MKGKENIKKWKCDNCGDITKEKIGDLTDINNEPMPEFGWGCRKCGINGRRKLVKV
jgi:rubredoxin